MGQPAVRAGAPPYVPLHHGAGLALGLAQLLFGVVAVASWLRDPWTIEGRLPTPQGSVTTPDAVPPGEWWSYGRNAFGQRYSPLAQITPANVADLQPTWTYHTGDPRGRPGDPQETTFEVTPLKIGIRLNLCTPHQSVVALNATTGQEVWRRDLQMRPSLALQHLTCRGLSFHWTKMAATAVAAGASAAASAALAASAPATGLALMSCTERLFMPIADGRLLALDADSAETCVGFGDQGHVNLWAHMPNVNPARTTQPRRRSSPGAWSSLAAPCWTMCR